MTARKLAPVAPQLKSPFLEGLAPAEVNAVLSAARQRRYPAGAVVAFQGTPADYLFLIVHGRARFFTLTPEGNKIILFWLPEGEVFGGAALQARPSDYVVSTETVRDSTLLAWDKHTIRRLARSYPQLLENSIDTAIEYFTFYVATHVALICNTASERVAALLVNLAQGIGHAVSNGIELDVNNEELAEAANVTQFTVSRLLSQWERQEVLVKSRGKVLLRSPEKLAILHGPRAVRVPGAY
jgi:CRP/FNR family transcriptional regulator, nitrogen oxide reductase regulator